MTKWTDSVPEFSCNYGNFIGANDLGFFVHDLVMWIAPDQWHYVRGLGGWAGLRARPSFWGCVMLAKWPWSKGLETNFHVWHMIRNDYNPHTMLNQFTPTRHWDFHVALAKDQHDSHSPTLFHITSTVTFESVFQRYSKNWIGEKCREKNLFMIICTNQVK